MKELSVAMPDLQTISDCLIITSIFLYIELLVYQDSHLSPVLCSCFPILNIKIERSLLFVNSSKESKSRYWRTALLPFRKVTMVPLI